MENEELENIDSQNDDQETVDSLNDKEEVESEEEQSTEEPEYTENEKQLYARAKKAEKRLKELEASAKPASKPKKKESSGVALSILDQKALYNADIDTQEDLDEVLDYADRKGISISEALNTTIIKTTLAEAKEKRDSAAAVNTGATRRGSGKISDDRLLEDARKGKMPESESDIARLAVLRLKNK